MTSDGQSDIIIMTEFKIADFDKTILNIRISPGFLLIREENDISNIHNKFKEHTNDIIYISVKKLKMATFDILRCNPRTRHL